MQQQQQQQQQQQHDIALLSHYYDVYLTLPLVRTATYIMCVHKLHQLIILASIQLHKVTPYNALGYKNILI